MALEHSLLVSSSNAVKIDPVTKKETPYVADQDGGIAVATGDVLRFKA